MHTQPTHTHITYFSVLWFVVGHLSNSHFHITSKQQKHTLKALQHKISHHISQDTHISSPQKTTNQPAHALALKYFSFSIACCHNLPWPHEECGRVSFLFQKSFFEHFSRRSGANQLILLFLLLANGITSDRTL